MMNDLELVQRRSAVPGCDARMRVDLFGAVYWDGQAAGFISHDADLAGRAKAIERECLALGGEAGTQSISQLRDRFKHLLEVADGLETPRLLLCVHPSIQGMKFHTQPIEERNAPEIDMRVAKAISDLCALWAPESPDEVTRLVLTREGADEAREAALGLFDWACRYFGDASAAYCAQHRSKFLAQIDAELQAVDLPGADEITDAMLRRVHLDRPRQ
jgi:hypothetical protein